MCVLLFQEKIRVRITRKIKEKVFLWINFCSLNAVFSLFVMNDLGGSQGIFFCEGLSFRPDKFLNYIYSSLCKVFLFIEVRVFQWKNQTPIPDPNLQRESIQNRMVSNILGIKMMKVITGMMRVMKMRID